MYWPAAINPIVTITIIKPYRRAFAKVALVCWHCGTNVELTSTAMTSLSDRVVRISPHAGVNIPNGTGNANGRIASIQKGSGTKSDNPREP